MRWTRGSVAAALVVATVAAVSGCVWAAVAGGLITPASTAAHACDLPAQPDRVPPGDRLTGPAVTALRGGAASHGFSVDGGLLSVEPPPPGAVPRVPRTLAECEALAAIGSNGGALDVAAEEWGLAVGYAMVTVSPGLPADSSSWQSYGQAMPGPASYRNRLAWVVVFRTQLTASCPAVAVTTPPATPAPAPGQPAYTGYGYEVFLIDAATGGDALIYDETQPAPAAGPASSRPAWRCRSRKPRCRGRWTAATRTGSPRC